MSASRRPAGPTYRLELPAGALEVTSLGDLDLVAEDGEAVHLRLGGLPPVGVRARGRPDEHLVGLGERFVRLDQTGRRWEAAIGDLLHTDPEGTYFYVPVLYSSAGYGVLLSSTAPATWDLHATRPGQWSVVVADSPVDLHLFRGHPRRILELATGIMGRAPLPPPWVFGVWKTTLGGSAAVLREAESLRREDLPVTACWTYDYYDETSNSGCGVSGTYPPGPYDDLPALVRNLHDLGYRVLGYVQPAIFEGTDLFATAVRRGYLVRSRAGGPATFPYFNPKLRPQHPWFLEPGAAYVDFTNPEAGSWFQGLLEAVLDMGFDGWMQDMGEHLTDHAVLADGSSGAASRNRYPLLYHRAAHEVWSRRPGAAIFARSGSLGSVPFVSAVWPGDQHTDWSRDRGLPSVLPAGPSAGLAGVLAWGPDIAGLTDGRDGGAGGQDEELWIRWCQYGALNPIMRDHLGFKYLAGTPVDLWSTEATKSTFRRYARLHLQLFPYWHQLAREGAETGLPIIRALLVEYPGFPEAWTVQDQYLVGPDLLVAPVHRRGARSRPVWFPPGVWVDWWEDRPFEGPGWSEVPAPLERIPLFRREGGRVPLLEEPDPGLDGAVGPGQGPT